MVTIGIDIGGTSVKMALIRSGQIIFSHKVPSRSEGSLQSFLPELERGINHMLEVKNVGQGEVNGIGISIPGIVDSVRMRVAVVNDKFAGTQPDLVSWAQEKWAVPLVMENDARCALIGEWRYGKAKGFDNVVIVTLGTGFGSSAVIDGKLLRGKHFMAGILGGHLSLDWKGLQCNCGNQGCVEAHGSTWNLINICNQFPEYMNSELANAGAPDFKLIFDRSNAGDLTATKIRNYCMDAWTHGIANLIYAYDPEIVILSGGVMESASTIIPYLMEKIKTFGWAPFEKIKFEVADNVNQSALLSAEYLVNSLNQSNNK